MISVQNLAMRYGGKELFAGVSLALRPRNRYGLVGANGSGKSTFMRLLLGEEECSEGEIEFGKAIKIGSLKQDQYKYENERVIDVVIRGNKQLWSALVEQRSLIEKPELSDEECCRIAELEGVIAENGGYTAEPEAEQLLIGLGIEAKHHREALSKLSGGYKIRVLLAQCLFDNPDVLLLDEPTNHLDILSIAWLEGFLLKKFKNILVVISHDHDFLNAVCNNILDVDYNTITLYPGNYTHFMDEKALNAEILEKQSVNLARKIEKDRIFIERFKASASRSTQAKSREKQLEKVERPEVKQTSRIAPHFLFKQGEKAGKIALEVQRLSQNFGEMKLFQNLSCVVGRGQKVAILGQNGVGKSTLLKTILGLLDPSQGQIVWGYRAKPSYVSQDHRDLLSGNEKVLDWLMRVTGARETEVVRSELARMLMTKDEVSKAVSVLSGGESTRLLFAKIALDRPSVIVLDEPTNHLDIESRAALTEALKKYDGTVLFVSHDRRFISELATRVVFLRSGGFTDHHGNYASFRAKYPHLLGEDA